MRGRSLVGLIGSVAAGLLLALAGSGMAVGITGSSGGLVAKVAYPAVPPPGSIVVRRPQPRVDLSSARAISRSLAQLAIDPIGLVVQRGKRNYAGPNCPGKGWSCTTARRVIQVARGGANRFECSPSSAQATPTTPPSECTIVQGSSTSTGRNEARCVERTDSPSAEQFCTIVQTNGSGSNVAVVLQGIEDSAKGSSSQSGRQEALISQTNGTGSNTAQIGQGIGFSASGSAGSGSRPTTGEVTQEQIAVQVASVDQQSDEGKSSSTILQEERLRATARAGTITQRQNADPATSEDCAPSSSTPSDPNQCASVRQNSGTTITPGTGDGRVSSALKQKNDLAATARSGSPESVQQTQGSPDGGLDGAVDQFTQVKASSESSQEEKQKLTAPDGATQLQFGPGSCCSTQQGDASSTFEIDQKSNQQGNDDATQQTSLRAQCFTTGNCEVEQQATTNDESESNSASGSAVVATVSCTDGGSPTLARRLFGAPPDGCTETGTTTDTTTESLG